MAEKEVLSQLSDEITTKIRRISITTSRIVQETLAGQYKSAFKGKGMEFDSVREYQPGDEVKSIDWNVTARTGKLQIKKFEEERELSVMLLLDASLSCRFGSKHQLKSEIAAEICSVLAFSAIYNKDKAGLIIFTDRVEKAIPPRKGTNHVLRIIREALLYYPKNTGTDINSSVAYLNKIMHNRSVCFIISDFISGDYKDSISIAGRRHDIIAVRIVDSRETDMPDAGLITLDDAETGEHIVIDTSNEVFRQQYRQNALKRIKSQNDFFKSRGIDHIDIYTDTPYIDSVINFFKTRSDRMRKRRHLGIYEKR
jgi:uncharacterized protein (DUF58 family)